MASLAPAAGHLVHMPAHVYIRTGDYQAAVQTNEQAAAADRAYLSSSGAQGIYPLMYYSHNLHFIAAAAAMQGNYVEAKKAADMLVGNVEPHIKDMPPLEAFMTVPMAVEVRFQKWNDLLTMPRPDANMKIANTFWHFAHGMALAATGKISEAQNEYEVVKAVEEATPADQIFSMPFLNKTKDVVRIAENVLGAKIAIVKKNHESAIAMLREAVATQDHLNYGEPPDWFFPVRESLGAALLLNGSAGEAEKVFREDLDRNPRNPRSLLGLRESLKAQNRNYDAEFVNKEFQTSWRNADTMLKVQDLT